MGFDFYTAFRNQMENGYLCLISEARNIAGRIEVSDGSMPKETLVSFTSPDDARTKLMDILQVHPLDQNPPIWNDLYYTWRIAESPLRFSSTPSGILYIAQGEYARPLQGIFRDELNGTLFRISRHDTLLTEREFKDPAIRHFSKVHAAQPE